MTTGAPSTDPAHGSREPESQQPEDQTSIGTSAEADQAQIDRFVASALVDDIEFLTARARATGSARANQALKPLGLRVREYSVLKLARSGLRPSQRELAEFLRLDPSQIVALVDKLERRDAIRREPDQRDRRSKVVIATKKGQRIGADADKRINQAENGSLAPLNNQEREQLKALLRRIAFVE